MKWGIINLYCAVCGKAIRFNGQTAKTSIVHHREFGYLCTMECLCAAEMKYTKMILGHDEPDPERPILDTKEKPNA